MNSSYPKISIITPSYNQGQYIEQTILSVINQNYPNLEYIIIDGGSTDNSIEIIQKYEKYLAYWISEKDEGMYEAIQKGFEKSTGEIMAWINSDDVYYPHALHTVVEIFTDFPDVQWLSAHPTCIDEQGRTVYIATERRYSKYAYLTKHRPEWIHQESTFWQRSLWERAGGCMDTSLKLAGDFELWMRFFDYEQLYVATTLIGGFRIRSSDQKTLSQYDKYIEETEKVIAKHLANLTEKAKYHVNKIKWYKQFQQFLFINKLLNIDKKLSWLFGYSPVIRFDREKQKFIL
jgi:glycosyltransferase involved in cell wall biosynthesis